jgi:hypothetical protein
MKTAFFLGLFALLLVLVPLRAVTADPWPRVEIPPQNARDAPRPTPRPPPGEVETRARHLFEALQTGGAAQTETALDFFLPREPFLAIKDMSGAAGYFATLTRAYRRDIERYRTENPGLASARFVRFELSRACTWMSVGREANRLPYWSCYRSRLVVEMNGRERSLNVHVLINWGDRWYVTHLAPLHRP